MDKLIHGVGFLGIPGSELFPDGRVRIDDVFISPSETMTKMMVGVVGVDLLLLAGGYIAGKAFDHAFDNAVKWLWSRAKEHTCKLVVFGDVFDTAIDTIDDVYAVFYKECERRGYFAI